MFTNDNRDRWASMRNLVANHSKQNAHNLKVIDDALFVVCLDDASPSNFQNLSSNLLHGEGSNRWHDKFQIIVFRNGKAGNVFEHSAIDGHTTIALWNYVCGDQENKDSKSHPNQSAVPNVEALPFEISPEIKHHIEDSRKLFHSFYNSLDNSIFDFREYGTQYMKQNKFSPDAFAQMAFQIAYYRTFGQVNQFFFSFIDFIFSQKIDSTYESANTKRFAGGRTECLRSVRFLLFQTHFFYFF